MIIDAILDRRAFEQEDGNLKWYDAEQVRYIRDTAMVDGFNGILTAIDQGNERGLQRELCRYIDNNGYAHIPGIKEYVRSVKWLAA